MSREIKFRCWSNEEGQYFPMHTVSFVDNKPISVGYHKKGHKGFLHMRFPKFILEQYTGLKDKNGKEIYEGDIVNIQGIKYYVDFEHGGFWFNNDNRKWKANRPFTHFQEINDTEVIGNIHENPELMEDENE